jgi:hypothetical protein
MFRDNNIFRLTWSCQCRMLRHNDLTWKFLLIRFYRRRMFGYEDLAYLTSPCRCYVLGHHGLTRVFRLCRCHMLRHDDLFRLTWSCRRHMLRHNDLTGRPKLIRPCR